MKFKIRLTHFKKLEKALLKLKKSMLTMKYKLLFQVSFTAMIKTSRKKLKKSTESWRIYVRVNKGIKFIHNNIDGSCLNRSKLHLNKSGTALLAKTFSQALEPNRLCNFNDSDC